MALDAVIGVGVDGWTPASEHACFSRGIFQWIPAFQGQQGHRAYERQSLILTSNLPFEQWTEILGNKRLTGALLDRLTHRVHILEANGEGYRLNDAKKKAQ